MIKSSKKVSKPALYSLAAFILLILLIAYGISAPEAMETKELTYVAELKSDTDESQKLVFYGYIVNIDNKTYFDDGTGRIPILTETSQLTTSVAIVHAKYKNGVIIAEIVHEIPYTKNIFILIGGLIVLGLFLHCWKPNKKFLFILRGGKNA